MQTRLAHWILFAALAVTPATAFPGLPPLPGQRRPELPGEAPKVHFATLAPLAAAHSGPSPAAVAAALRTVPVTGRLGASGDRPSSLVVAGHLLRIGDPLPTKLLPPNWPRFLIADIGLHHWSVRQAPADSPADPAPPAIPLALDLLPPP